MQKRKIPYGKDELFIDLEEKNFLFYAENTFKEIENNEEELIINSLNNPIGVDKLENSVKKNMIVSIIVDDNTRPTPQRKILPIVIQRLIYAGIKSENIKIIVALGTHRQMSAYELSCHLGHEVVSQYKIVNINYKDRKQFIYLGNSKNGTPIEVYKEVIESDFKIAIGNIAPHIAAGWGGGAKMIQPGICSEATTAKTHLMACIDQNVLEVCGNLDNYCRHEMEEIGEKVGLDFIINTVLDNKRNIIGIFSGHYIFAHIKGVELAKRILCPSIPQKADILIASADHCSTDYWQGCKPFIFSQFGVEEGGILIFVIRAEQGLCGCAPQHEETLKKYLSKSYEEIICDLNRGLIEDTVGINVPIFHSRIKDRIKTICISEGMTDDDIKQLGFHRSKNLQEALTRALSMSKKDANVGIIPYAGDTLVYAKTSLI